MQKNEGNELRYKLKGTGKEMGEIAEILGMTRQNLSYHLRKSVLEDNFKRLLAEKSKDIFHVEQITVISEAGEQIGKLTEQVITLQGTVDAIVSWIIELSAASKGLSYLNAKKAFEIDVKDAIDRRFDEARKKLKQEGQ